MTSRVRKAADWTVGLGLIGVGIVGGFIPIMQGWIFIVAGLAVLSSHSPLAKRLYERCKHTVKSVRDKIADRRGASQDPTNRPD